MSSPQTPAQDDLTADGRTPHPDEPAEGAVAPGAGGERSAGREAHPADPAEGADDPAVTGEPDPTG